VCRRTGTTLDDGFKLPPFEDYPVFDPTSFGCNELQLYKMHGSINWWTDRTHQRIFNLSLELKGANNIDELMIYPAQDQDIHNYPFNYLQTVFIKTLNYLSELIVVGHKFGDINITSAIKAILKTRRDFKLTIVNPSATNLKNKIFDNDDQVVAVDTTIEEWVSSLGSYKDGVTKLNRKLMQEQRDKIIADRATIIEVYKRSDEFQLEIKRAIDSKQKSSILPIESALLGTRILRDVGSDSTPNINPGFSLADSPVNPRYFPYKNTTKTCSSCGNEFTDFGFGLAPVSDICPVCSLRGKNINK
jgi:hypothetical protein